MAAAAPLWQLQPGPLRLSQLPAAAAAAAAELAAAPPESVLEFVEVDLTGDRDDESGEDCGRWCYARRPADFSRVPCGLLSASVAQGNFAALTVQGAIVCSAGRVVPLPWAAAAVGCGVYEDPEDRLTAFCVAVRRGGGAVCCYSWRAGGDGDHAEGLSVEVVRGLPAGDPVAALEAGDGFALAVTASGAVYSWAPAGSIHEGSSVYEGYMSSADGAAVRVAEVGRVRCLACGSASVLAETEGGELLLWDLTDEIPLSPVPTHGTVAFPLRCLAAANTIYMFVDAVGMPWTVTAGEAEDGASSWRSFTVEPVKLPEGRRAVRVAAAVGSGSMLVALTADGELWDCSYHSDDDGVIIRRLELPLGLLPFGGCTADRILLLPDCSCGKPRLRLFARIAVRLGLPSDPLRAVLVGCAVDPCYITGLEHDPFSWPHYEPSAPAETAGAVQPPAAAETSAADETPAPAGVPGGAER